MNRNLLRYYLGRLADAKDLSSQCAGVRDLMLATAGDDRQRLAAVLDFLDGGHPIRDDTVRWLRRGIRGHYGGEGYVLDVPAEEEAAFWLSLHQRYPENAWLCFVAADASFGRDTTESLRLFFRAFELDSSLVHELEGGVSEFIGNSPFRLRLELVRLADAVAREDWDYLIEALPELQTEHAGDADALRRIEEVAGATRPDAPAGDQAG